MNDIFIIVPTLNPNKKVFLNFLKKLKEKTNNILVYNDGSRKEYDEFFTSLEKMNIIVLKHHINLGKGRAMKDAFNYLLVKYPNLKGAVTADSDGQHSVDDILKVQKEILNNPNSLILGCRNFNSENVPKRNRFGNKITCQVFKLFVGLKISDTQTGLRGYPKKVMEKLMDVKGERFEYETNMLIETLNKNIPIKEVSIETIYIEEEYETHFNPIKDSIAIYKLFIKYIFASVSSFILDILLFSMFTKIIKVNNSIFISTVIARIISSIYNYVINSRLVFKKKNNESFIKYALLVIIQMFISAYGVQKLFNILKINAVVLKICVDVIIFMVNFVIQRKFIFVEGEDEKK